MKLYIGNKRYSSWSLRPWLVLKHFAIPFTEELIPLDLPETEKSIRAVSPSGRVPVLHHDGLVIWESLAICEYLADLFPEKSLWPSSQKARAQARTISTEMHSGFSALRTNCPMKIHERFPGFQASHEALRDLARIDQIWCEALERSGGPYLFGEFSIADAMYAPVATRTFTYHLPLSKEACKYRDQLLAHQAMCEWKDQALNENLEMKRYI